MRAEDLLPDDRSQIKRKGVVIRKGSVGAFLANAALWRDPATDPAQREEAERDMAEALPALRALGLFDEFELRDAALAQWVREH